jgi:hypothetical protein
MVNENYEKIKTYNDYIVYSIALQLRGEYTPIAAFEKKNGEIEGFVYMVTEDAYALRYMRPSVKWRKNLKTNFRKGRSDLI